MKFWCGRVILWHQARQHLLGIRHLRSLQTGTRNRKDHNGLEMCGLRYAARGIEEPMSKKNEFMGWFRVFSR